VSNNSENPVWYINDDVLSLDIESSDVVALSGEVKWFQFLPPSELSKETDLEKKEKQDAIQEQLKRGILKIQGNNIVLNAGKQEPPKPTVSPIKISQPQDIANKILQINKNVQKPKKVGPNEPCPCGSGKKYKKCHGRG
jgi:hypothetical protein